MPLPLSVTAKPVQGELPHWRRGRRCQLSSSFRKKGAHYARGDSSLLGYRRGLRSAYNYGYLGKCSSLGIDAYGHAPTTTFTPAQVTYNGTTTTVVLKGYATNPVPLFSFAIDWNFTLNLTQPSLGYLNASGSYIHDCYPAHELSVSNTDAYSWTNPANDIFTITSCLAGLSPRIGSFQATVPVF